MTSSDHELLARIKTGDEAAFEQLFGRHKDRVFSHALRMLGDRGEAEDVLQEAFLYVFRSAPRYEPRARFTTLLYRVARSLCLDRLRKAGRRRTGLLPPALPDPDAADPPERAEAAEERRRLEKAVGDLGDAHREVISLRLTGGLSNDEIASILEIPVGTVKSRVHHAMQRLRRALGVDSGPTSAGGHLRAR